MKVWPYIFLIATAGCSMNSSAADKNYLFPDSIKIPLIGPSKPASVCMLPSAKLDFENELNANVDIDCIRLSVSATEAYDEENDVYLLLAYANSLHERGWETTDMVSGTPLLKSPESDNGCTQHLMMTGGWLGEYFPDEGYSEDEGQYIFISMLMDDNGSLGGTSLKSPGDSK